MTEAKNTVTECGVPPVRLGVAVVIALAGFSFAVMGFVMDNTAMIVMGLVVGGAGSTAVNALANAADRWRRRRDS
jgi:NAD/NADP transhydrogenase beta subunit